ncbi:hypothetical protein BST61_g8412 [Cercospora zeina]
MTKFALGVLLSTLSCATAFPAVVEMAAVLQKREEPPPRAPLGRLNRPNTGLPPSGFNTQDQFVDVTDDGRHPFIAPSGRNGLSTITEAIAGLGEAYNMAPDLAGFLAILAVGIAGDPLTQTWSIGTGFTPSLPLFPARGILGTHNKYEGDASIMRGDAFLNGGSPGVFQLRSFEHMYSLGETFGFDEAAAQSDYVTRWSILNNPYYFSAPFPGLVAPAAHNLVINLMSNHSAEVPGGTLTRETLIPTSNAHNIPEVVVDLFLNNAIYPGIVRFGGNTGTVNSFAGVDLQNLTNGVYNLETLSEGNNGACFLLQASLAGLPDAAAPALGAVGSVLGWALQQLGPLQQRFGCPQLKSFNNNLFNAFPGASYTGTGA